jgi:hypothetical protein
MFCKYPISFKIYLNLTYGPADFESIVLDRCNDFKIHLEHHGYCYFKCFMHMGNMSPRY